MATWPDVQKRIHQYPSGPSPWDVVRREYLGNLSDMSGRNTIIYYSGWLQKHGVDHDLSLAMSVSDTDKNAFMSVISGLNRKQGLDLFLHTPGGDIAATESLVDYLRAMFDDIRVIVPQLAMSAGTMIALASNRVMMGKQSSLGPIDPQFAGLPAHGIISEFERAKKEVTANPQTSMVWGHIIGKYSPTFLGECANAVELSDSMVRKWLTAGMFNGFSDGEERAARVVQELGSHSSTLTHSRHISVARAKELGIIVEDMEGDQELQDAILSVHHAAIATLAETNAFKIVENQLGNAVISQMSQVSSSQ